MLFYQSPATGALINFDQVHSVEIVESGDQFYNKCFEIVAFTSLRSVVLDRPPSEETAIKHLEDLCDLLKSKKDSHEMQYQH